LHQRSNDRKPLFPLHFFVVALADQVCLEQGPFAGVIIGSILGGMIVLGIILGIVACCCGAKQCKGLLNWDS